MCRAAHHRHRDLGVVGGHHRYSVQARGTQGHEAAAGRLSDPNRALLGRLPVLCSDSRAGLAADEPDRLVPPAPAPWPSLQRQLAHTETRYSMHTHLQRSVVTKLDVHIAKFLTAFCIIIIFHLVFSPLSSPDGQVVCLTPQCIQTSSYLLAALDKTADPCEDFFQFACGSWNRKHVIPEDRSSISTFEVMADQLQIILKGILEEDRNRMDNEATVKAKYFYQSCMDMGKCRDRTGKWK